MKKRLKIIKLRIYRLGWILALISMVSTVGAVLMQKLDLFGVEGQELSAYDGGLGFWTKTPKKSSNIVVLGIDEKTIQGMAKEPTLVAEYGKQWPYKRALWRRLFGYLGKQQVRAIVFDSVMTESKEDPMDMRAAVQEAGVPVFIGFEQDPSGQPLPKVEANNRFLPTIAPMEAQNQPPVVPPADAKEEETFPVDEPTPAQQAETIAKSFSFPISSTLDLPKGKYFPQPAFSELWDVARFGLLSAEMDEDGKMRRTRFVSCDPVGNCYPNLSVRVMADLLQAKNIRLQRGKIVIGGKQWKTNPDGSAWVHFGGKLLDRFPVFSLLAAVEDSYKVELPDVNRPPLGIAAELLKGKVIFVAGGFAAGTGDVKATPFDTHSPGVAKHAAELDNFLNTGFIVDAPYWSNVLVAFLLALLSVFVVIVADSAWIELVWPIAVFFGFYLFPGYVVAKYQVHFLSAMPALAGSFASVLASVYKNFLSDKQRNELKELFGRYMEKHLVDVMVETPTLPTLSGEEVELTLLFSCIPHFSTLLDQAGIPMADRIAFLNVYHNKLTHILTKHGACIDKYLGDEIRAFFNAPIRHADHALLACKAALEMQQAAQQICQDWQKKGWPPLQTAMAIHTDVVWVGNMGSDLLIDYTVMGPGVQDTLWLREQNDKHATSILLGRNTYHQCKKTIDVRRIASVDPNDRTASIRVYALLGLRGILPTT